MARVNLERVLFDAKKGLHEYKKRPIVKVRYPVSIRRLELMQALAEEFNVRIEVWGKPPPKHKGFYGCSWHAILRLYMAEIPSENWFISVLYHELGHVLCRRAKRHVRFHESGDDDVRRKTYLKAERYIDALATAIVKDRHPNIVFQASYSMQDDVALAKKYYARKTG